MSVSNRFAIPVELLKAAHSGDQTALVALLEVAQPDVQRYARLACRSSTDAEDAAQDALWQIYRQVGTLRVLSSFAAWTLAIIRRECQRLARLATSRGERTANEEFAERLAARPDLDMRIDLAAAIQSLPDHYREVLLLRDIQEMTINEIRAHLQLTRETVKARLHRARLLVREYLKD